MLKIDPLQRAKTGGERIGNGFVPSQNLNLLSKRIPKQKVVPLVFGDFRNGGNESGQSIIDPDRAASMVRGWPALGAVVNHSFARSWCPARLATSTFHIFS